MNCIQRIVIKIFRIELEPIYTLNIVDLDKQTTERASGRSIRLADTYIQLLFKTGRVSVSDHHNEMRSNVGLARIIARRLQIEHPSLRLIIKQNIIEIENWMNFQEWKQDDRYLY